MPNFKIRIRILFHDPAKKLNRVPNFKIWIRILFHDPAKKLNRVPNFQHDFELFIDFSNTEMLISHELMIRYGIFFVQ